MVGEGATSFGRNEDNPLETDVVIIDEVSMVDIFFNEIASSCTSSWNASDSCR